MAMVKENVKGGKVVSYKFTAFLGRDENGNKKSKCMIWCPPTDLTLVKIKKMAQLEAEIWKRKVKEEYLQEQKSPKEQQYNFDDFVNDVWLPSILDGTRKPKTIVYYSGMLKKIMLFFESQKLNSIGELKITEFLSSLRKGEKPLAPKTIKHYYIAVSNIFNFAYRHEFISKNPIDKVDY